MIIKKYGAIFETSFSRQNTKLEKTKSIIFVKDNFYTVVKVQVPSFKTVN